MSAIPPAGGVFISFEGIDGSGKSSQARLLAARLREQGREVVLTREPGGSEGAEEIRKLVLEGEPGRWSAHSEILLFTAARRDHLERVILPALERGAVVITDRFADSTRCYQGRQGGEMRTLIDTLHHMMIPRAPDLTVLIDLDPETGLSRALSRAGTETRFEAFGLEMQAQMRGCFQSLAGAEPDRFAVINGEGAPEEVAARVWAAVEERLR